ncbi:cupin-like domain-containing protein [uncultured Sphingomonas sp.]|uniref:cupin-like domain-containing protein n=1 Tax=uncultured Sphingomonas sp. TaxID=158754 RepID=UPI002639405A|nr:cupin-like domain-containing protein [uncultured Sphingomonas sp.]
MATAPEIDAAGVAGPDAFLRDIVSPCRPVILRGLARDWPVVAAAAQGTAALAAYLSPFDAGAEVEAFVGPPGIAGRYDYGDAPDGFNFIRRRMRFADALAAMLAPRDDPAAPSLYVGSLPINAYLPGFSAANRPALLSQPSSARIWLGHASTIATHYDTLDNLACVVAGRRRFTLYPPEAIGDLYVGPIDHTMAGQPTSLATSAPRSDPRFPRFTTIADQAIIADLDPGDALYLPKLWWHQVDATSGFNGLVNHWWDAFSAGPDAPYATLLLAMIAIAERPAPERAAWRSHFDHYVFRSDGHPLAHLPPEKHGLLGPLRPDNYGRIRARVMQMLRGT